MKGIRGNFKDIGGGPTYDVGTPTTKNKIIKKWNYLKAQEKQEIRKEKGVTKRKLFKILNKAGPKSQMRINVKTSTF